MHELTQYPYTVHGLTPLHQMCGGVFKPRAMLVRKHTAWQSFCSDDLFCLAVTSAVTLPIIFVEIVMYECMKTFLESSATVCMI